MFDIGSAFWISPAANPGVASGIVSLPIGPVAGWTLVIGFIVVCCGALWLLRRVQDELGPRARRSPSKPHHFDEAA
jgi:hypothetical protein